MRIWGLGRQTCQHCKWWSQGLSPDTLTWGPMLLNPVLFVLQILSNLCIQETADAIQNFSVIQKAPALSCTVNFGPVDRFTLLNLFWSGWHYANLHRQSLKAVGISQAGSGLQGEISMDLRNSEVSYIDKPEHWLIVIEYVFPNRMLLAFV